MSFDDENAFFRVLINHEEQYSLWPEYKTIPGGWRDTGCFGKKAECLEYVNENWKDMRPLSLRKFMQDTPESVVE